MRAFVRGRLPSRDEVDDVVQDVLYQYVRINTLIQPVEQAMAWMFRVAHNEIINRSRKKSELRLPDGGGNDEDWVPDDALADIMFGEASKKNIWPNFSGKSLKTPCPNSLPPSAKLLKRPSCWATPSGGSLKKAGRQ